MMMHLVTGLAVWMVAAVALGLLLGRAMHGYSVTYQPVPVPVADAEVTRLYERAA
jgi:uncharacterized membrane protein YecN with MAPEG domain